MNDHSTSGTSVFCKRYEQEYDREGASGNNNNVCPWCGGTIQ